MILEPCDRHWAMIPIKIIGQKEQTYMGFYFNNHHRDAPIFLDLCKADKLHMHGYTFVEIKSDGIVLLEIGQYVSSHIFDLDKKGRLELDVVDDV